MRLLLFLKSLLVKSLFFVKSVPFLRLLFLIALMYPHVAVAMDDGTAFYPFTGNASEATGHAAPGEVTAAVLTKDRFGEADNAYLFNGVDSSIRITRMPVKFNGDFAVSFWQKSSGTPKHRMHAVSLGTLHSDNLDFDFNDSYGLWVFWNGGGSRGIMVGRPGEFTDGAWHQILLQRIGSEVQLYVDGVLKGKTSYSGAIGSTDVIHVGKSSFGPYSWDGALDDLRFHDHALTDSEIRAELGLVRLKSGPYGAISGPLAVAPGDTPTYAIEADAGYRIKDVMVDGVSVGAVSSYTFSAGVASPVTISAEFSLQQAADGLLASYPLDEDASEAEARFEAGAVDGAVATDDRFGAAGGAYLFNGVSSSIRISRLPAKFAGDFAVSFWQKSSGAVTRRMHAVSLGTLHSDNLDFDFNDSYGLWVFWNGGGSRGIMVGRPGEFTDGSWHQILLQRVGSQVQLYVDGALRGTKEYVGAIGSADLINLGKSSFGALWWSGSLDDLRIYDRGLSAGEIEAGFGMVSVVLNSSNGEIRGPLTVPIGGTPTYAFVPDAGYQIEEVTVNGVPLGALSSYTFSAGITSPVTISAQCSPVFAAAGPVASYLFSGDASEAGGMLPAGVVSEAVLTRDRHGMPAHAYLFNGANSSIEISSLPVDFSGDFAISFWQKSSKPMTERKTALSLGTQPGQNIDFDFNDGSGLWVFWNGGGGNGISVGAVGEYTDGGWRHILLQRVGSEVQLYVDGILKATTSYSGSIGSASKLTLGKSSYDNRCWDGALDDLRIHARGLSAAEIETLQGLVRLEPGPNGHIQGPSEVAPGDQPAYSIVPATGYRIEEVAVDGVSVGAVPGYTFLSGIASRTVLSARFSPIPLTEGMLASYSFSGDASEGGGLHPAGTVNDAIPTPDRFGRADSAFLFDGVRSSISVPSVPAQFAGDFAVSFWFRSSGAGRMHALSLGALPADNLDFDFNDQSGLWVFWNGGGRHGIVTGRPGEFTDGSWRHLLLQRAGSQVELYVDGVLRGVTTYSRPIGSSSILHLGKSSFDSHRWNGEVDDLRIYSRALAGEQIPGLRYQWSRIKPSNRNDSLVAGYSFSANADNDKGTGFNGTLHDVVPAEDRYGSQNRAYLFNGHGSFIDVAAFTPFSKDFALAFWQKSCSSDRMHAFSMGNYGEGGMDLVLNDGSGFKLTLGEGRVALEAGNAGEFTDCAWRHMVVQRSGETIELYVDGSLRGSSADAAVAGAAGMMRFGRSSAASEEEAYYWNGALDDFLLYNKSFTAQEIVDLQHLQFQPRDGAGALSFKGKMWLLGGWNPALKPETNSEVWSSSDGEVWELVAKAPWEGRHESGFVVFGNKMWVVGGDKNSGHYQNEVWNSENGVDWQLVTGDVPWADRATHYTLVFDDKIWVMGGQEIWSPDGMVAYNDVYYSSDGATWNQATPEAGWSPRGQIDGNVVFQGKMWVIGGGTYDVRSYNNDVWNSPDGVNWEKVLDDAPWNPRQFHSTAVFDNNIWVLGGDRNDPTSPGGSNDVWFSPDGKSWNRLPDTPWSGRHAASTVVFNDGLWVIAGSSTAAFNDVWKLSYAP